MCSREAEERLRLNTCGGSTVWTSSVTLVLGMCEAQTKSLIWMSWRGFIHGYGRGGRDAWGGGGPALRRRLSSLCQTLSPPAPPQFLSWRRPAPPAAVPRAPSAQALSRAPSRPPCDRTPRTPSGTSDSTEAPPGPIAAPSSVSASRFVFSSRMVLPAPWHPAEQSGPLLARSVLGALSLLCLWLPSLSLCTGHGPGSCRPLLLPATLLVPLSLELRPFQTHLPPPGTVCPAWRLSLTPPRLQGSIRRPFGSLAQWTPRQ